MNNEITPEERAEVISRLKYCPTFTDCYLSGVLSFNEDCDDIGCFGCHDSIRKKLIALIEPASVKTCYIKYIADEEQYYGAVCSACNFELSRYMDDYGSIGFAYCPNCGAKVVV